MSVDEHARLTFGRTGARAAQVPRAETVALARNTGHRPKTRSLACPCPVAGPIFQEGRPSRGHAGGSARVRISGFAPLCGRQPS
eukprot:15402679-Alexandrium_andersonii.AAC.1